VEPRRNRKTNPIKHLGVTMSDYIRQQAEARAKAWEEAKALLDSAAAEKRDLSAEENQTYDRIMADLDSRSQVIETMNAQAERENRAAEAMKGFEAQVKPAVAVPAIDEAELIRSLARGEIRSHSFEKRDVTKGSTGAPVPTSFYDQVILLARHVGPMLETSTILNTAGGENLQIPSLSAYSTGTVSSEAALIGESDPTFNAFKTLGAYKYSFLTQISREMVEDAGVDILGFLATQTGNALGYAVNNALTVGTGTTQPTGIVTAAGSGITGGTGVSGAFTADNMIDLVYSVDTAGRTLPGTGWQMNAQAIAAVRKLKDSAGQYLFSPSLSADARDLLLGYPIFENPAMAAPATSAKSVIFGHLPSYFARTVGGLRLDRSDDYAFQNDLITFRATMRVDGNLIQTSHVKYFAGAAS
jgi:HK97 family phage major capsid protein